MTIFFNSNVSNYNLEKINKQNYLLLYTKFIIRTQNKYKLNIIDENNTIVTSGKQIPASKGFSVVFHKQIFRSKYYKNLQFIWLQKKTSKTANLYTITENLLSITSLIIFKSKKKGFLIYSKGFKGFLKKKDILQVCTNIYNNLKTNFFSLLTNLNKTRYTHKYIIFRLPCKIKSYLFRTLPQRNNFSKVNKKRFLKNRINLRFTLNTK